MKSRHKTKTKITIGIRSLDPPYVYDDSERSGALIKMLQVMAHNLNLDIHFNRYSWSERLRLVANNELDGTTYASFSEERLKIGAFPMKDGAVDPGRRTMSIGYHFYKLRESPFMWDGENFHHVDGPIGTHRGAIIADILRRKGLRVVEFESPTDCLRGLLEKRVTATVELGSWVDIEMSADPEKYGAVEKILAPIEEKPYYLMLSHKFVREHPELAEQIWDEIGRLREEKSKIFENVFVDMFQELQASQRSLQEAYDNLEIKVKERTIELAQAKRKRAQAEREHLRPPALEEYGLLAALKWYVTGFQTRTGIEVSLTGAEPEPRLPVAIETVLFRITQEALTNVARHARAGRVEIALETVEDEVRLTIADDGVGFDPTAPGPTNQDGRQHWGLVNMIERAYAVGGRCRVDSGPGEGTRVIVEIKK